MSVLQTKKRKEAEENLRQADKCLAKTVFRWAPDYLAAAPLLEKAADAFRAAGDFDAAKRVFAQVADVQLKNKSSYRAAQAQENVAKVVVQQMRESRVTGADKHKYLLEVKAAFEAASSHYVDMGELGKAADALMKAATTCEESGMADMSVLKELMLNACSMMESQDKPHFAIDTFRKALSFLVKNALYADSLALLTRQIKLFKQIDQAANVHKCYLSEVVLLLTMGDVAAADKKYMAQLQEDAFLSSDECALAEDLVRAYKLGNEDLLQTTIRKQGFSFLDNQVARLVRKLTIYGGGAASAPRVAPTQSAAAAAPVQRQPPQPRPAAPATNHPTPSKNPFAPAPEPIRAAPVAPPAPVDPPAPVAVAPPVISVAVPAAAPEPAPAAKPAAFEDDGGIEDYDFNDTTARATVAFHTGEEEKLAFDFDSLEFSMPPESNMMHSSATTYESDLPATSSNSTTRPPPVMDDDMFDLT
uniref:Gamma-soluble NSF attachment protein n=1 Tax=Globisporangium ultimum (strain ATCC 200006 / CBS 805.95 / DAOM BR144) TaxID=431595 RepID=K3WP17_GLOUD